MKKEWIIATRPWSLVASIGPILIGTSLSWNIITISIKHFLLTLWGGIFLQISANLINSYYDYKMGLDQKETSEDRTLFDGKHLSPNQVKIFGIVCFLISFFIGFYFVFFFQKIELFYLFFIGGFFAIFYTAQPLKLKYYALGDICIFLCFGPLIIEGTYFIQTGEFSKSIFYFSIPSGLLADAILHVNNTRDIQVDLKGGAKTLPQFLGKTISLFFFISLIFISYLFIIALSLIYHNYFLLLPFFILPMAFLLIEQFKQQQWKDLCSKTAQFGFFFNLLLCLGIISSNIIP